VIQYGCRFNNGGISFHGSDPWDVIERSVAHYAASGSIDGIKIGRIGENDCDERFRFPIPIVWIEGEWIFGSSGEDEEAAVITYATEPSPETGHVGWCWWALGKIGSSKTLKEAMAYAENRLEMMT
jgi:hypothetical protein